MLRQDGRAGVGIAELRKQVRQIPAKGAKQTRIKPRPPAPPPKKAKHDHAPIDRREEQAERAERLAQQSHSSSLLKQDRRPRAYMEDKPKGGMGSFVLQVAAVIALAGGAAYLLDPNALASIDFEAIKEQLKLDF